MAWAGSLALSSTFRSVAAGLRAWRGAQVQMDAAPPAPQPPPSCSPSVWEASHLFLIAIWPLFSF